jgi:hypothetical protein
MGPLCKCGGSRRKSTGCGKMMGVSQFTLTLPLAENDAKGNKKCFLLKTFPYIKLLVSILEYVKICFLIVCG